VASFEEPLKKSANIVHGNSLMIDWEEVINRDKLSYILGNIMHLMKLSWSLQV